MRIQSTRPASPPAPGTHSQRGAAPERVERTRTPQLSVVAPTPLLVRSDSAPPSSARDCIKSSLLLGTGHDSSMAAQLCHDVVLPVDAATHTAFAAAAEAHVASVEDALQLFGRYRAWSHALGLSAAQQARWDVWMAGFAAMAGCSKESLRCVRLALSHFETNDSTLQAWSTDGTEAFVRGEGTVLPDSLSPQALALPAGMRSLVLGALAMGLARPVSHMPGDVLAWQALLQAVLKQAPASAQPQVLLHLAQQPGFDMFSFADMQAASGTHDAWAHTIVQLSRVYRARLLENTELAAQVLQYASLDALLPLLLDAPRWREAYWRTAVGAQVPTPAHLAQLQQFVPRMAVGSALRPEGPLARYFPQLHWQQAARALIRGESASAAAGFEARAAAMQACLEGTELAADAPTTPELNLVRDAAGHVARADWAALTQAWPLSPWVSQLLQNETPQDKPGAQYAQANRLQAVGRFLHLCREVGVDPNRAPGPAVLQTLLRLPCQAERRVLLQMHLAMMLHPTKHGRWLHAVQRAFEAYPSPEARALALALVGKHDVDVHHARVRALMNCRAVAHDGTLARRLLAMVLEASGKVGQKFVETLFGWANPAHLMALLTWSLHQDDPLQAAKLGDVRQLPLLVERSDNTSVTGMLLVQRRAASAETYLAAERQRLVDSAAWLQKHTTLSAVGEALTAYLDDASSANLQAMRAAVQAVARGAWRGWVDALSKHAMRLHALEQWDDHGEAMGEGAFMQQACVRQFLNRRVMPLVLLMEARRGALMALGRLPHTVHTPDDVVQSLGFLPPGSTDAQWTALQSKVYAAKNVLIYWEKRTRWSADWDDTEGAFKAVIQSVLNGTYTQYRRQTDHMAAVLKHEKGAAMLPTWEAAHQEHHVLDGKGFVLQDSADLGHMLAAVTEIDSCQSVHRTDGYNVGMLGRMQCASKHVLTLRDEHGVLRARAMLRVMLRHSGEPVLSLSRIYTEHAPKQANEVMVAYVARRAAALGLDAVLDASRGGDVKVESVHAEMPDYYDGGNGLDVCNRAWAARVSDATASTYLPAA